MTAKPIVSVLIISMNHSRYIDKCVQSILSQTYSNLEILYLDNNSSDESYQKAINVLNLDGRFKYVYRNSSSLSFPQNLNFLIKKATGKYISAISGDDWFDISNIEEKVNFLEANPTYAMVYGNGTIYYEDTGLYRNYPVIAPNGSDIFQQLLNKNFIFAVGAMIKRSIFDKIGYYDENLKVEDWDMWIRIAQHSPIGFLNKKLAFYRRHTESFSTSLPKTMLQDTRKVIKKYMPYNKQPLRAWIYYLELKWLYRNTPLLNIFIRAVKKFTGFKKLIDTSTCY